MNKIITAFALAGLVSTCSIYALAADKSTEGSALPPGTAMPQTDQSTGIGTGTEGGTTTKGIDGTTGSNANGADSGTTDNGPSPAGGAKGGGEGKGGSGSGG